MKLFNIKNICKKLGESNKATYAVVAIAVAKGIFRPIFTLCDKKEKKETKIYTAAREGLTEVVAIPTYIGVGKLAETITGKLKGLSPEKLEIAKHNANFIGVCAAALFIIPALASVAVKPFSEKKKNNPVKEQKLNIKEYSLPVVFNSFYKQNANFKGYNNTDTKAYCPLKAGNLKVGVL